LQKQYRKYVLVTFEKCYSVVLKKGVHFEECSSSFIFSKAQAPPPPDGAGDVCSVM
jgi:hypothetical protein